MIRSLSLRPVFASVLALTLGGCVVITDDDADSGADTGSNSGNSGNSGNNTNNSSADETGNSGGGGGEPSQDQVDDCQMACDDLLFFDCLTADTHENCFVLCGEKDATSLDTFDSCVSNTLPVCENATPCYDNLDDADPVGTTGGDGATCTDACEEWLGAGCQPFGEAPSCEAFCSALSDPFQQAVVECVEGRDGCTLPPECDIGGGEGGEGEG